MWNFEHMTRNVLPELHILLGIGNKTQDNVWDFMHERVEAIQEELIEVLNFNVLCYITLKRSEESLEKFKEGCNIAVNNRMQFNATYKKN